MTKVRVAPNASELATFQLDWASKHVLETMDQIIQTYQNAVEDLKAERHRFAEMTTHAEILEPKRFYKPTDQIGSFINRLRSIDFNARIDMLPTTAAEYAVAEKEFLAHQKSNQQENQ